MRLNSKKRVRTAALALALAVVAGCGGADVPRFNDQIAESNKKLAKAAVEFKGTLAPLGKDQKINLNAVKNSHDSLVALVKEIREERKRVKVPSAKGAEELHKAYDAFLDGQQRIV